jgi:hypothetical protein
MDRAKALASSNGTCSTAHSCFRSLDKLLTAARSNSVAGRFRALPVGRKGSPLLLAACDASEGTGADDAAGAATLLGVAPGGYGGGLGRRGEPLHGRMFSAARDLWKANLTRVPNG